MSLNRVGTAEYRGFCTEHGMNTVFLAVEPRSTALSVRICAAWLRCILPISGSVRQKHGMVADGTRCQRVHPRWHYGHSRKHHGSGGNSAAAPRCQHGCPRRVAAAIYRRLSHSIYI